MFGHLKKDLTDNLHLLVLGTGNDAERILDWITNNHHEKDILMTIADDIATIKAGVAAIQTTPVTVDLTPVETAVAAVKTDTAAILADLTPTPPPSA